MNFGTSLTCFRRNFIIYLMMMKETNIVSNCTFNVLEYIPSSANKNCNKKKRKSYEKEIVRKTH